MDKLKTCIELRLFDEWSGSRWAHMWWGQICWGESWWLRKLPKVILIRQNHDQREQKFTNRGKWNCVRVIIDSLQPISLPTNSRWWSSKYTPSGPSHGAPEPRGFPVFRLGIMYVRRFQFKVPLLGKSAAVVVAVIGGLSPSPSRTCLIRTRFRNTAPSPIPTMGLC